MPFSPIQLLPFELLSTTFKLCISDDTPVQDLILLTLVCKLWRSVVEGTPSLWCCISGHEAVPRVRKALTMAKDASLEILYDEDVARTSPEAFFEEICGLFAQWKFLSVRAGSSDSPMATLQTTPPPNLKTLQLRAPWSRRWKGGSIALFQGEPAPLALKELCVDGIPVVVEPLRLSGLRFLALSRMPIVSEDELLRILRESPALERCYLYSLVSLQEFPPGPGQEPSRLQEVKAPSIELSHLRHLALCGLPVFFTHLVLSVIRAPNLRSVAVDCKIDRHGHSPISDLFTTHISHHSPTLTALTSTAQNIEIISYSDVHWRISAGNLIITLEGGTFKLQHLYETLEWLFSQLGKNFNTLPVSLSLHELEINTKSFIQLTSILKVTKLELWTASSFEQEESETQPRNIISLLSRPLTSTPSQWVVPELESLDTNVVHEDGKTKILDMVRARHAFIETQNEGRREVGDIVLKPFKEFRLRGGRNGISGDHSHNTEFLVALQKAARDAEIWWEEFKWTGSQDFSAAMKSNSL
ncbi:hypothetical protein FRC00_006661 [Tulasnella sp. 408]|nr:hypothetical protein FRC00_006661 [Tulasnella sp. 408]